MEIFIAEGMRTRQQREVSKPMSEVLTETEKKIVTIKFRRWRRIGTDSVIQLPEAKGSPGEGWEELPIENSERERLRDQVIEAAKEFTSNDEARSNWDALAAYRKLCGTVDALLDFEGQNKE